MKKSLGTVPKTRLKRIFEALMVFANENKRGPLHLKHAHQVILRHGQQTNQISVRASIAALASLTNQYEALQDKGINEPLVSWQVAESLEHLETTLGILIDCRRKRQGATERYFKLELWYPLSEVRLNLAEVNCRWPTKSHSSVSKHTSDPSLSPFAQNQRLLKLISAATKPIDWRQFAVAIGLSEENELQNKKLLADTCILLLANPPQSWKQYLYRFSPLHLLEAGEGGQLLSFILKIPPLQRSTVDLIVDRIVNIQSWPSGETNSFLLQLAHSEEWVGLKTLTEVAWKLVDAEEHQLAAQLVTLLPDTQLYKSQIQILFEIKRAAISQQPVQVILLAGKMLRGKGLPPSLKAKVIYLLIQGLMNTGKNYLAWRVCERAIKDVSPETDLDDWLRFQCTLCLQDIFFDRSDCARARLIGLEKIVTAQHK
jgi:Effector-associated domain 4